MNQTNGYFSVHIIFYNYHLCLLPTQAYKLNSLPLNSEIEYTNNSII